MYRLPTIAFLLVIGFSVQAQQNFNMTKLANVQYPEGCNDIWGYTAPDGTEYAILGTRQATAILSLADPANPVEVAYISGSVSTWRDMKTFGHYAYVTADAGSDGLLIINLEFLPDSVQYEYWKPDLTVNGNTATMLRCHNLYIDEQGYAFLSGCNPLNSGGVLIFDVFSNPGKPTLVGHTEPVYSHDNFSRGDTVYSANLSAGFYVTNVVDKENPITLATQETSFDFCHNAWLSDDGNYLFTTDEKANAFLDAYDISDLTNIKRLDKYQPADTRQTGVIPHNTHYFNGYNIVSWYTDGVKVVDAHKPDNLIEVANFDTYVNGGTGFQGDWGAYPFLPSQRILVSDINTCLWVFEPNYVRAAYLEGLVVDATDQTPIQGATVTLLNVQPNEELSGPDGTFKTGSNQDGQQTVRVEKNGYLPKQVPVDLLAGEVTDITVSLTPLAKTSISGMILDKGTGLPVGGGYVAFTSTIVPDLTYSAVADPDGLYSINDIYLGDYEAVAGSWGYLYTVDNPLTLTGPANQVFELEKGYQDDFVFDFGWTVTGTANKGLWERGVPEGTFIGSFEVNPSADVPDDIGNTCYVTGLEAGTTIGDFDLDNGNALLLSPAMDLDEYLEPVIQYQAWFVNTGGNNMPDDTLKVWLTDGTEDVLVREYFGELIGWQPADSIAVRDYFNDLSDIRIRFEANDEPSSGHVVEAGVDAFLVRETGISGITEPEAAFAVEVLPNPSAGPFTIRMHGATPGSCHYRVTDLSGRLVEQGSLPENGQLGGSWPTGTYFLDLGPGSGKPVLRLVKIGK